MPRVRVNICSNGHTYNSSAYELPATPHAELLVGTAGHCQVVLPPVPGLAPVQARIVCEPQGYLLVDVAASAAAQQAGQPAPQPRLLEPGCECRMGVLSFVLEADRLPVSYPPQQACYFPVQQPTLQPGLPPMPQPVQYVPVVIMNNAPAQQRVSTRTSKFSRREASLLLARFHRHKMHNAYLWNLLWAVFTFLFLLAVCALAIRAFCPDLIKSDTQTIEGVRGVIRKVIDN